MKRRQFLAGSTGLIAASALGPIGTVIAAESPALVQHSPMFAASIAMMRHHFSNNAPNHVSPEQIAAYYAGRRGNETFPAIEYTTQMLPVAYDALLYVPTVEMAEDRFLSRQHHGSAVYTEPAPDHPRACLGRWAAEHYAPLTVLINRSANMVILRSLVHRSEGFKMRVFMHSRALPLVRRCFDSFLEIVPTSDRIGRWQRHEWIDAQAPMPTRWREEIWVSDAIRDDEIHIVGIESKFDGPWGLSKVGDCYVVAPRLGGQASSDDYVHTIKIVYA